MIFNVFVVSWLALAQHPLSCLCNITSRSHHTISHPLVPFNPLINIVIVIIIILRASFAEEEFFFHEIFMTNNDGHIIWWFGLVGFFRFVWLCLVLSSSFSKKKVYQIYWTSFPYLSWQRKRHGSFFYCQKNE